ncbi:MAG: dihydropteroate synthase [Flavobacteriaceae bacterium]|nr:dihydropteroate synthase [Flavobacteriaceae bacterium]
MNLNCRGQLIDLNTPKIIGILNITPDSFYDGGKYNSIDKSLKKCDKLIKEGATFIDVGAVSTRPGAKELTLEIEKNRLLPVFENLLKNFPDCMFSIDTFRSEIAEETLNMGAAIINDISGGDFDKRMFSVVGRYDSPYILTHSKGKSKIMQNNPKYKNVVTEVISSFSNKIQIANRNGIKDVIIDVGFGFGKSIQHNFELLKNIKLFQALNCPVLTGLSRKSMIWKYLDILPEKSLNGTTFLHAFALQGGSQLLRVHDVKSAKECIDLLHALS